MAPKKITPKKAQEMMDEVEGLYRDALSATSQRVPSLIEQMAFYRGYQWGTTTPVGWVQDEYDLDEARETLNYVRPTVRTAVSDVLRSMPNPSVVAASDDQMSHTRAKASQKLLRSFLRSGVMNFETMFRAEMAAQIHGAVWYKVIWDPNAGRYKDMPLVDPETGVFEEDDFGLPKFERRAEGDIRLEFVDIISAVCDPHARNEHEVEHIFHRKLLPVRTLEDHFPMDAFNKPTKGRWQKREFERGLLATDIVENDRRSNQTPGYGNYSAASGNELADFVEYWEKPSNRYPRGRLLVFSGSMVVAIGPLPYEWPWVLRLGQNLLPNGLYPDGVVRDIIPIQRTINLNASKKREWMEKILSPPLLVPHGSGIDVDMFDDVAGSIIQYNPGLRPDWMRVPDIPSSMFSLEEQSVSVLQTISTYSDISRGQPPRGYDSGRALAYLYEFQKAIHEVDIHLFRHDVGRLLSKCLQLCRDYYDEGRVVKILGDNNKWSATYFKRDDYDFEAEVVIESFSGQPNSRALRYAEAIELYQLGAFDPDNPSAKSLRQILEVDYDDAATHHRKEIHYSRARAEQAALVDDPYAELMVLGQDNHDCHLDLHIDFAVTEEFLSLPENVKERFLAHIEQHEMWNARQTEGVAAEQSMLSGQVATAGAPPPKSPMLPSPRDGGGGAYGDLTIQNPELEEEPLPTPEELTEI